MGERDFISEEKACEIIKEMFGEIYLCGKKTIISYDLFIVTNISTDHHIDAA